MKMCSCVPFAVSAPYSKSIRDAFYTFAIYVGDSRWRLRFIFSIRVGNSHLHSGFLFFVLSFLSLYGQIQQLKIDIFPNFLRK